MLIIKLIHVSEVDEDGNRIVSFEFNGQPRDIKIRDKHVKTTGVVRHKVDKLNLVKLVQPCPVPLLKLSLRQVKAS